MNYIANVHALVANVHDHVVLFPAMSTNFWFSSVLHAGMRDTLARQRQTINLCLSSSHYRLKKSTNTVASQRRFYRYGPPLPSHPFRISRTAWLLFGKKRIFRFRTIYCSDVTRLSEHTQTQYLENINKIFIMIIRIF